MRVNWPPMEKKKDEYEENPRSQDIMKKHNKVSRVGIGSTAWTQTGYENLK